MTNASAFVAQAKATTPAPSVTSTLIEGSHGLLIQQELPRAFSPVSYSRELERIRAIPRRLAPLSLSAIRAKVYSFTGGPHDTPMTLWPLQEQALAEALEARGLFAPMAVGTGKSLTCMLLPTVLDAPRGVILTTAGLVRQAKEMHKEYKKHFSIRSDLRWLSYGILSSAKQSSILEKINPSIIISDEAQALANGSSARVKRFIRYMKAHPETIFCALSGSITKRSLKDFEHLMRLALRTRSPLPRHWPILEEWSEAVDGHRSGTAFRPPGALLDLLADTPPPLPPPEATPLAKARYAVRRRMTDTVGVVSSTAGSIDTKLTLRLVDLPESRAISKALTNLASLWQRPDKEEIAYALEYARVERQLKIGGFYRWLWPNDTPDYRWLGARATYHKALRGFLKHRSKADLDSPFLVERAIERGEVVVEGYADWKAERARLEQPPTRWMWLTDKIIRWAAAWAHESPGIVWIDSTVPGRVLAELAGIPWYGAGPEAGRQILKEDSTRSFVASIRAHGIGRNLQTYNRSLVLTGVPTGSIVEQLLGRTHRPGQKAGEVIYEIPRCFYDELVLAMSDARYIQETTGAAQKVLSANIDHALPAEVDALLAAKSHKGERRVENAQVYAEYLRKLQDGSVDVPGRGAGWAPDEAGPLGEDIPF